MPEKNKESYKSNHNKGMGGISKEVVKEMASKNSKKKGMFAKGKD